jgi:hypothetical protein
MRTMRRETLAGAALAAVLLFAHESCARADEISISLATDVTGLAGDTIAVFGNLTNNTSNTLYLGNDAINLTAPSTVVTAADDIILNGLLGSGLTSIAAGTTLDHVDLFSVQLLQGPSAFGGNSFALFGGTDAVGCATGASDCITQLGSANFSVSISVPTPLPATGWLLLSGLGGLGALIRRIRGA